MLFIFIFTIAIFYFLFTKISFSSVVEILLSANPFAITISLLLVIPVVGISGKRWQIILNSMTYDLSYKYCLRIIIASIPFSMITPAKAGDVVRAYFLRDKIPMTITIGGVLSERLIDLLILLIFAITGLIFYQSSDILFLLCIILVGCGVLIIVLLRSHSLPVRESWRENIQNLSLSLKILIKSPKNFSQIVFFSIMMWILSLIQVSIFFIAVGIDVPFLFVVGGISLAILIGMIPVSLGGMGTRDTAIIVLFSSYAPPDKLLCVGILFSLIRYWIPGIIGLLLVYGMPVLKNEYLSIDE